MSVLFLLLLLLLVKKLLVLQLSIFLLVFFKLTDVVSLTSGSVSEKIK